MIDPKIYLAVDNCFASKRWTRPSEWLELLGNMGVTCVEASADNECDPLYMDRGYLERWVREVQAEGRKRGVRVANLYSGHGTYATLGLTHHDPAVRDRIQNEWLKPMADIAASLSAGLGFYCHAFSDSVLQSPEAYKEAEEDLYTRLADIAEYARTLGIRAPGVEQMYTPHQIPWTIEGSKRLLREVFGRSQSPFYMTLDTGHQSGQSKFLRPNAWRIEEMADRFRKDGYQPSFWLGPKSAYALFDRMIREPAEGQASYAAQIVREMDRYPHLFAEQSDGDTYRWLEELGGYSPIIHLQQTTGASSSHLPFTEEYNRNGIILGEPLLKALEKAYQVPDEEDLPPKCAEIYLTLEIFSGTSEMNADILKKMRDSIVYWRQFIPADGMKLSEAVQNLP
ncbi:sugar phosphate isomerase/epimerase [Cohnella sp. REN36]|uniref:sugar phosphate isomerase/epimerase family protein n=1 Tax=Cohnella sp. REN36 TaxID=2887347 RepID=UPI001D13F70A|nr:TIM barrel protein [Cohnella sp. REN36]MCC3372516.1 sugar phosphate isomerase/epimerase [Cohnella sp. REN36]